MHHAWLFVKIAKHTVASCRPFSQNLTRIVILWQAHTPDLLGKSDIFGPLPIMDLPVLQRSESPVPSSKRSSRRSSLLSSKPLSSSSDSSLSAASRSACSHGESIHSFSDLLTDSQELQESPERFSVSSEQCGQEAQEDVLMAHPSIHVVPAAADEEVAVSQHTSSELAAPTTRTCQDPSKAGAMHSKHSSDLVQATTQQTIQSASETGTGAPAAPAEQQQACTRSTQETPVLLETPEAIGKAPSGSCQPLSAPLHFSETVMRGAAVVQSSLCQQTPLLTLQDGVAADERQIKSPLADNVCKSTHNLTDTSADAISAISDGASGGTADQRQDSTTAFTMADMSKGLRTAGNESTAEVDAAISDNRQTALSRLKSVTRKSLSRGPSFLSQPSRNNVLDKGRTRQQQRPASSPAATKLDFDPPGVTKALHVICALVA